MSRWIFGGIALIALVVLLVLYLPTTQRPSGPDGAAAAPCVLSFDEINSVVDNLQKHNTKNHRSLEDVARGMHDVAAKLSALTAIAMTPSAIVPAIKPPPLPTPHPNMYKQTLHERQFGDGCQLLGLLRNDLGCGTCTRNSCAPFPWGAPPCGSLQELYYRVVSYPSQHGRIMPVLRGEAIRSKALYMFGLDRGHAMLAMLLSMPQSVRGFDTRISQEVRTIHRNYVQCAHGKAIAIGEGAVLPTDTDNVDTMYVSPTYVGGDGWTKLVPKVSKRLLLHGVISRGASVRAFLQANAATWEEESYFPFSDGLLVLRRVDPACPDCYYNTQHHPEITAQSSR
eukprot:PhM_4_TR11338/c0_g1_i3/m.103924